MYLFVFRGNIALKMSDRNKSILHCGHLWLVKIKPHYKGTSVIGRCTYMLPVFTQTIYDYLPLRWWMPGRTLNWLCTIVSNFKFAWNKAGQSHSLIHFGYTVMFGIHTTLCHLKINTYYRLFHTYQFDIQKTNFEMKWTI